MAVENPQIEVPVGHRETPITSNANTLLELACQSISLRISHIRKMSGGADSEEITHPNEEINDSLARIREIRASLVARKERVRRKIFSKRLDPFIEQVLDESPELMEAHESNKRVVFVPGRDRINTYILAGVAAGAGVALTLGGVALEEYLRRKHKRQGNR